MTDRLGNERLPTPNDPILRKLRRDIPSQKSFVRLPSIDNTGVFHIVSVEQLLWEQTPASERPNANPTANGQGSGFDAVFFAGCRN
ncbi:MAG: hypothetical protein QGF59_24100, partial [Pirellulaceae bacterium]|nr:hypothetical protein [Pirellulaceae bacterium]